jgi:arabinofuranosyltransferase
MPERPTPVADSTRNADLSPAEDTLRSGPAWMRWALYTMALAVAMRVLSQAWVSDEAYVSMRTVDQFVNGGGLRWNPDERVQSFSHPLWLGLVSLVYAVTREVPWTLATIGALCSTAAFTLIALRGRERDWLSCTLPFLLFVTCPPLFLFGSSGLENPLSGLLLVGFGTILLNGLASGRPPWMRLTGVAALAITTRLDLAIAMAPGFLFAVLQSWPHVRWKRIAFGSLPCLLWSGFALVYYGTVLPNTLPARFTSSAGPMAFMTRGVGDLTALLADHPSAAVVLGLAAVITIHSICVADRDRTETRAGGLAALGLGAGLYSLYIIWIGGDPLVGRFWTTPLWISLFLIAHGLPALRTAIESKPTLERRLAIGGVLGLILTLHASAWLHDRNLGPRERPALRRSLAHMYLNQHYVWVASSEARAAIARGHEARDLRDSDPLSVIRAGTVGFVGMTAGRDARIVDASGRCDVLLARFAPSHDHVGARHRTIPRGYTEWRRSGDPYALHPDLARYLERMQSLISGPLFAGSRVRAIVDWNLGKFDVWLQDEFNAVRPGTGESLETSD